MESSDRELLCRFVTMRDEAAFRLLVDRHLPVVHGVACRVTANEDFARDISQGTFVRLARRAALIPENVSLAAWLHRVAHHLAIDLVRSEERRKRRELAASHISAMDTSSSPDWSMLAPVVDSIVDRLPAADREVILLRFYRNESHSAVARQLGLTEVAAKKRATRALEKLRVLLAKQGIATTSSLLATLLPTHAASPVPSSLVISVSTVAKGITPLAPQGINLHLAMTTAQKTAIAGAAIVFLGSLGYVFHGSMQASGERPPSATIAEGSIASTKVRTRGERPPGLGTDDRLERLRQIIAIPSRIERPRQMLIFIDELSPDEFRETADQMHGLGLKSYFGEFSMLLESWATFHPLAAVAWANETLGGPSGLILSTWGETDPDAAIDWVMRNKPEPNGEGSNEWGPLLSVLSGIAVRDPAAAIEALDKIPEEKVRIKALTSLAEGMNGSGEVERLLAVMEKGPMRSELIAWSLSGMVIDRRWESGLGLLLEDEGAQKLYSIGAFFTGWHREDEQGSINRLSDLPKGPLQDEAVAAICIASARAKPQEAYALLDRYPGVETDIVAAKMAEECPVPGAADDRVLRIKDETLRYEILKRRLTMWIKWDEQAARKWMEARQLPPAVRESVEGAVNTKES